jgi:hypothetical protein
MAVAIAILIHSYSDPPTAATPESPPTPSFSPPFPPLS